MCNNPSVCIHDEWIWTHPSPNADYIIKYRRYMENPLSLGYWLIYRSKEGVDTLWGPIHTQTVIGKLGIAALASTRIHADIESKSGSHIIKVYTYDYKDEKDVYRVRDALRDLGVFWKIYYYKRKISLNTEKPQSIYSS